MKILLLQSVYTSYTKYFLNQHQLTGLPYVEQTTQLENDYFSWINAWQEPMGKNGFEFLSVYFNIDELQETWCKEHGFNIPVASSPAAKRLAIVNEQIKYYKPDILLTEDMRFFDDAVIRQLKRDHPSIKTFIGHICSPYYDIERIKEYDIILSCLNYMTREFNSKGIKSYLLPHAFNHNILKKLDLTAKVPNELSFLGGLVRVPGMHADREEILLRLVDTLPINIYSDIYNYSYLNDFLSQSKHKAAYTLVNLLKKIGVKTATISNLPIIGRAAVAQNASFSFLSKKLINVSRPPVYGIKMFQQLRNSAISFNIHIDSAKNEAANMRLFEATGVGSCLLTDYKQNINDFFVDGEEVVTYKSFDECIEKAKWLFEHPAERKKIAVAGQQRVLKDHTFIQRAKFLSDIIKREC